MQQLVVLFVALCISWSSWVVAQDDSGYLLGPGDKIIIQVYGEEELKIETQLTDSGKINYPFLGEIMAKGLTIKQLESRIYSGLKGDYFVEPNVFVGIVEYRPFFIHGEVKQPGGYPYKPGMTVNQAIALAAGLTERASREKIFIYREGNKTQALNANLNSKVSAGDTITIEQRFF
ncbi:polysaccharide biosynthesis/export family protein [Rheinheimera sp. 1928-s]|uniref:polysaccharide biosynthesis/export family protein n=1 Tax=Rheinheimera sp. 1928-s TaxID=3033803 RepID=UPI00262EA554|nr:polysaccharide biosynthesis/export family protein [Rheinheimera sp. 1928-s]MDF3125691.1 polysaccharide export protein [Rheinheimera sp. 1928-s]